MFMVLEMKEGSLPPGGVRCRDWGLWQWLVPNRSPDPTQWVTVMLWVGLSLLGGVASESVQFSPCPCHFSSTAHFWLSKLHFIAMLKFILKYDNLDEFLNEMNGRGPIQAFPLILSLINSCCGSDAPSLFSRLPLLNEERPQFAFPC